MADHILEMRNITKTFPGVKALQNVNLTVDRGEVHAICGENGAGKSTLMKVLSGVYPHGTYEGDIVYEGSTAIFSGIRDSEKSGVVIIHQELALSPFLSIAENIFLGNECQRAGRIDWNETNLKAADLLSRVGLQERPVTRIADIGVGKQQLVEIAKALSKDVKLLILDEPTAALNDEDSAHLLGLISGLREDGITSIIISHKLNEIKAIADRVTIIRDGQTIETLDLDADEISEERIIRGMVGRDLESRYPERVSDIGDEVLRIEDWTVHHPLEHSRVVVDKANLYVRAGEVVGIAGSDGCRPYRARDERVRPLVRAQHLGQPLQAGQPIQARTVKQAIAHGIAYATEDRKRYGLNLLDDIKRNISGAALDKLASWGHVDANREQVVANGFRASMRIKAPNVAAITGKLSGGNQQKVVLSKWLFADPDVLIVDEPTRGIDVGAKYEIYTIINEMAAQGKAIIVISSELPELLGICDRIYALAEGRITGEVDVHEAHPEKLMQYMTKERD